MIREQLSKLVRAVARKLLDPGTQLGVSAGATRLWQRGVGHVTNQGVLEDVLHLARQTRSGSGADEPAPLQRPKLRRDVAADAAAERFGPEDASDHSRLLEHPFLFFRNGVDSRRQQSKEGIRQGCGVDQDRASPAATLVHKGAFFDQTTNYLLEKERIALRLAEDLGRHRGWNVSDAQDCLEQLLTVLFGKGTQ